MSTPKPSEARLIEREGRWVVLCWEGCTPFLARRYAKQWMAERAAERHDASVRHKETVTWNADYDAMVDYDYEQGLADGELWAIQAFTYRERLRHRGVDIN